ncbi:MAG: class I SAM-dependent methyltransferase [Candidatus Andersenbacteria bacterium]|nr:class I SAM-dependent methyltransferase [Candidatus Andersenbacteria bacterium]
MPTASPTAEKSAATGTYIHAQGCLLCHQNTAVEVLNLGSQPLANKYPRETDFSSEDFVPLQVMFCTSCKNVQLSNLVSRSRMFEDYYYLSSVNPGLVRHFNNLAQKLKTAQFVVDIGSNDGILLQPLKDLGVKALGVDPSINVSKIANDAGLPTITAFFDTPTAEQIKSGWGQPDVVVASSIFTHLEDPHQFIDAVKVLMADNGSFIIEVEYIGNIIKDVQFERFYLDRMFYYSLTSLRDLCAMHNMVITDVEEIEPHGGSLRVTIKNNMGIPEVSERVARMLLAEADALTPAKLQQFKSTVDASVAAFKSKLIEYKNAGLRVAGYGCPARVTTITNYGRLGPDLIEYIIDDSPLKQHKYSPGMHIPIFPKEHLDKNKVDVLVVFAYEYFTDIKQKTGGAYRYLIPIPPREVA